MVAGQRRLWEHLVQHGQRPLLAVLVILMGIAPLMPWRKASRQKLGRLLLWPVVVGLAIAVALYVLGVRTMTIVPGTQVATLPVALFYGFVAFTAGVTLLEFWRGTQALHRSSDRNYLAAFWMLIGRNRRRYGGYCVHIGILMMALGVIGTYFFQVETQRNLAVGQSLTITSPFTGDYTLTYGGLKMVPVAGDVESTSATLQVSRNGQAVGELHPTYDYFVPSSSP